MTRICPAHGCPEKIPPRRLMCEAHYKRVPREQRANVLDALTRHGFRSREYLAALTTAIRFAEQGEKQEKREAEAAG